MRTQRCFAIKSGVDGMLDATRQQYGAFVEEVEKEAITLSEVHGVQIRASFTAARGYHLQISAAAAGGKRSGGNNSMKPTLTMKDLPQSFLQPQRTRNGAITFTTENVVQADNRGREVLREIFVMSNNILQSLMAQICEKIGCLFRLSECVSVLDVVLALTEVSMGSGYVRPTFGSSTAVIKGCHPILHADSGREVVPNDILATSESTLHVLTGEFHDDTHYCILPPLRRCQYERKKHLLKASDSLANSGSSRLLCPRSARQVQDRGEHLQPHGHRGQPRVQGLHLSGIPMRPNCIQ